MTSPVGEGLIYNQVKAGLTGSAHDIATKIVEVSKDTKYYQYQKQRSKRVEERLDEYKRKIRMASTVEMNLARKGVEAYIKSLEKKINFNPVYMHADLDSFYASVECLDDPSLKGIPYAVVGSSKHGVVSTSSYEARKFGVRSGMAIFIAQKLCPELRLVPVHLNRYKEMSSMVQSVFAKYDPYFVSFGLDEATLDVTKHVIECGRDAKELALQIQKEVFEKTNLTISIGIAHTQQLSKISSDINKPNGVFESPKDIESLRSFLRELPIRKIPGIGGVAEQILKGLGVEKIGDIFTKSAEIWLVFSPSFCQFLFPSAVGASNDKFKDRDAQKSISKESTFDATSDRMKLFDIAEDLSNKLHKNMVRLQVAAKTVSVKFKDVNFNSTMKSFTFDQDTCQKEDIIRASFKLINDAFNEQVVKYRLLGIKVSNLRQPGEMKQKSIKSWIVKSKEIVYPSSPSKEKHVTEPPEEVIEEPPKKEKKELVHYFKLMEDDVNKKPKSQSAKTSPCKPPPKEAHQRSKDISKGKKLEIGTLNQYFKNITK